MIELDIQTMPVELVWGYKEIIWVDKHMKEI